MHIIGVSEKFEAPSPGSWELESTHQSRPMTRWMATQFPEAMMEGFRAGSKRYGWLLDCMEMAVVNGFLYSCARPVGAPRGAKGPPPKLVFKLLTRLHPEMRRRIKRSEEVFEKKVWREDVERWDEQVKPSVIRENRQMQTVDVSGLTDADLVENLEHCRDLVYRSIVIHHTFNAVAMVALGDFLLNAREWTGLSASELLPLLRGASAVSLGAAPELERLVNAISQDEQVKTLLATSDSPHILERLLTAEGEVGKAARNYVEVVGVRVATGYDVSDLPVGEVPDLLVETIRAGAKRTNMVAADTFDADVQRVRALVPLEHQAGFDSLLEEAWATYRIRDERGYLNDAWSIGIARRSLLEAGRRLKSRGLLHEDWHVFDLEPKEIIAALTGRTAPSADDVAAYSTYRTTTTTSDAPRFLGLPPSGPPPAEWLPGAARRMARIINFVLGEMFARREDTKAGKRIEGFAASPGEVVGTARLVIKPADMAKVRSGEVLVTRSTSPSYNALLPLIRGVVTDRGGTLSHAALVAREYGIPAVVGCGNATEMIPDGATVRVNGTDGTVELVG